jgi:phosphatidate cytidylyltransferase
MLIKRVVTALVLLLLLGIGLTVAAPWGFPVLALAFVAVAVREWMSLMGLSRTTAVVLALLEAIALSALALYAGNDLLQVILTASGVLWIGLMLILLVRRRFPEVKAHRAAYTLAGILFPGACAVGLLLAYRQGLVYMVSALALVWIADIAAYFCGRAFGRHKLAPSISPGKTIEGAVGGIIAVVLLALASTHIRGLDASYFKVLEEKMPVAALVLVLVLLVALSITGDLFESHLKRQAGVKDSGSILPGHGGVLDRIDALLPVVPIAVLFGRFL